MADRTVLSFCFIFVSSMLFNSCTSIEVVRNKNVAPTSMKQIAILSIQGLGEKKTRRFYNSMTTEMLRQGFNLVERKRLLALLKEQRLTAIGITDTARAAQIGRTLGATAIILGQVKRSKGTDYLKNLSLRVIDVESSAILMTVTSEGEMELDEITYKTARSIRKSLKKQTKANTRR